MHEDQACCSADSGITAHQLYLSFSYIYLSKESCRNWAKRSVYRQGTIWEQFCDEGNTTALTPWFSCVYLCNSRTEEGSRVSSAKSHEREGKRLPVTRTRTTMLMPGKNKIKYGVSDSFARSHAHLRQSIKRRGRWWQAKNGCALCMIKYKRLYKQTRSKINAQACCFILPLLVRGNGRPCHLKSK